MTYPVCKKVSLPPFAFGPLHVPVPSLSLPRPSFFVNFYISSERRPAPKSERAHRGDHADDDGAQQNDIHVMLAGSDKARRARSCQIWGNDNAIQKTAKSLFLHEFVQNQRSERTCDCGCIPYFRGKPEPHCHSPYTFISLLICC